MSIRGALAALVLVAAACGGEPVAPHGISGTYALTHADGAPTPGVVFDGVITDPAGEDPDFHLRVIVTGGTLTLGSNGRYEHALDLVPIIDGTVQTAVHWRDRGQFSAVGDSVRFDSEYLENVAFSGQRVGQAVHVQQDVVGEGRHAQYVYTRQ